MTHDEDDGQDHRDFGVLFLELGLQTHEAVQPRQNGPNHRCLITLPIIIHRITHNIKKVNCAVRDDQMTDPFNSVVCFEFAPCYWL